MSRRKHLSELLTRVTANNMVIYPSHRMNDHEKMRLLRDRFQILPTSIVLPGSEIRPSHCLQPSASPIRFELVATYQDSLVMNISIPDINEGQKTNEVEQESNM